MTKSSLYEKSAIVRGRNASRVRSRPNVLKQCQSKSSKATDSEASAEVIGKGVYRLNTMSGSPVEVMTNARDLKQ